MVSTGYVTFDSIDQISGAGKVCWCEINALKKVSNLEVVVCRSKELINFPLQTLNLDKWYQFNPFLYDYFAAQIIPQSLDFIHCSCSPALAILEKHKPKKYVVNIVAHELQVSIEEHERYYGAGTYPFAHNTDPYLHDLLLKHAENADVVLTPSLSSANWIMKNIKTNRVEVIPHGTDIPNDNEINPIPSKFIVGYLGVFGPDKGLPYLLLAWKYFNNPDSELIFAGSCDQAFKQDSIKNAFLTGVNRFRLLGWVNNITDFYNGISVYVQPSVTEGFGIEILEAMSYGRPVIASSGAGGADVISDGIDGFVVPPRDPKAILDKLNFFDSNPNKVIEMGARAKEKSKGYSWDKIGERYEKLYTEIFNGMV